MRERFRAWLELHLTAWRLGVSADWLRDARERVQVWLFEQNQPRTLVEWQRDERRRMIEAGWTTEKIAQLDQMHAMERESAHRVLEVS